MRHLLIVVATAVVATGLANSAMAGPEPDPGPSAGPPVGNRVVFTGNYDAGNLAEWGTCQWKNYNNDCSTAPATYSAKVTDGGAGHPTAARFEVRDGDVPPFGGGERAEVSASNGALVHDGDERWYEFSLRFDESFKNPAGGWFILMQWHAGSGSPPLAVEVSEDGILELRNNRVNKATPIGPIQRGQWVDYVLHAKFSQGSGALVESWVNGVKQPGAHTTPNMADNESYLKMGIYRDGDDSGTAVVWQDGLRVTAP